jgi:uncharacterized protein (TIGR03083 family)
MPIDLGSAYLEGKRTITALVTAASPEHLDTTVPACPLWSVADVVRHLTGVATDVVGGNLLPDVNLIELWQTDEGARTGDDFTDRHVTTRRGRPLAETLAEWDAITERLLPILRDEQPAPQPIPFITYVPVNDITIHMHDVRGALGQPGDRDGTLVSVSLATAFASFALRCGARSLPPLRMRYDGKERVTGDGEVAATWSGNRFELFRALVGRRSNEQIAAMDWDGDPTQYLPLISMYGPRADALVE